MLDFLYDNDNLTEFFRENHINIPYGNFNVSDEFDLTCDKLDSVNINFME